MTNVVIFGIGPVSDVVTTYLERESDHSIVGYVVDAQFRNGIETKNDKPVFDWETLEQQFTPNDGLLFGPTSYRGLNSFRRDRFLDGKRRGYSFLTFIHPATHVYTDKIGENCFILEQNVIQPFVEIGDNVILWSNNHIGHHAKIGDHCYLASQVGIAGHSTVGHSTFFGGQSGLIDNKTVGHSCIIGAGSTVLQNLSDETLVMFNGSKTKVGVSKKLAPKLLG